MAKSIYTKILNDYLNYSKYEFSEIDIKLVEKDKAQWMTDKLFRRKFRKTKIYENTYNDILGKIRLSVDKNLPVHFTIIFGGYKHFWNFSYPTVDWAELFNLKFMSEFVAPILAIHKPGVVLDYASEDVIITKMNNYPKQSLDKYANSFQILIDYYSERMPKNFQINYVRTGDKYDSELLFRKIDEKLDDRRKDWSKLTSKQKEINLKRSNRSFMFKGEVDYSDLNESGKNKLIEKSKQIENLFYEIEDELIDGYYYEGTHIPIALSWGLSDENFDHWLTLGSVSGSSVDFWIGRGILEIRDDKLVPRVVSHSQYEKIKNNLITVEIDLPLKGNFKYLEISKEQLEFKK
ncbi:MAG: hypothetical protein KAI67_02810 [Candidatus Pacebacteria bacterium]|nr:hypothetical protein [Candidatus Paceibacterota bacterium]